MYNNSASSVLPVYNPSHNITSLTDLSNNFLFPNDHDFYKLHQKTSIIFWVWYYLGHNQPAYQADNLYSCPSHHHIYELETYLFVLHVFSKHGIPSHVTSDKSLEFVSNFFCFLDTAFDM